jgi:hypothetical protein
MIPTVKESLCKLLAEIALAAAANQLTSEAGSALLADLAASWEMLEHTGEQEGLGVLALHQKALDDACWRQNMRNL